MRDEEPGISQRLTSMEIRRTRRQGECYLNNQFKLELPFRPRRREGTEGGGGGKGTGDDVAFEDLTF